MEGNLCNKALTSAGTESGIFLKEGGGSNGNWFSLELKLDDFTSGFRTTDMAGGCEEVVAAGSWIGTGAGAGGELNKHDEADEAAENKKGAGKTAEGKIRGRRGRCSASKLYLVDLWNNSDLELSQKVNAQNRTSYSSLQKTGCEKLALKLHIFF
jgi:hypothetical protein